MGEPMTTIPEGKEAVEVVTLTKAELSEVRTRFSFLADRDGFKFEV
jgi:hypothetical protein